MAHGYQRYHIEKIPTPNLIAHPCAFKVKIRRFALLKLLVKELFLYRGKLKVVASRPCAYGVFSGPAGGFMPRQHLCVGCLRCTIQHPKVATILPNPKLKKLGNEAVKPEQVNTLIHEASQGSIPVKGAGYRGKFGGTGWDGLWTDMSEIVRPTRDGIYGREWISTQVILGEKPSFLYFDSHAHPTGRLPRGVTLELPLIFNALPPHALAHPHAGAILTQASQELQSVAILPFDLIQKQNLKSSSLVPLLSCKQWPAFRSSGMHPSLIELSDWNLGVYEDIKTHLPDTLVILRTDFEKDLLSYYQHGVRLFHLIACDQEHETMFDRIQKVHLHFVKRGLRDTLTLIGTGGIVAAEHLPKALLAGLDAVALDTALIAALQGALQGRKAFYLPKQMSVSWGVQRLKNLMGAWRDQLVECLGAMGMRETQHMRAETGRVLFQKALENEAFGEIRGYENQ